MTNAIEQPTIRQIVEDIARSDVLSDTTKIDILSFLKHVRTTHMDYAVVLENFVSLLQLIQKYGMVAPRSKAALISLFYHLDASDIRKEGIRCIPYVDDLQLTTIGKIGKLFLGDIGKDFDAFGVVSFWRGEEAREKISWLDPFISQVSLEVDLGLYSVMTLRELFLVEGRNVEKMPTLQLFFR